MHRWLARLLAALVVALGLVPLTAGASWACSCGSSGFTESQEWRSVAAKAPTVYVAEVTWRTGGPTQNADGSTGPGEYRYSLQVVESLKGGVTGTRTGTTSDQGSACGATLQQRRRVLVYDEELSLCGGFTQERVPQRATLVRDAVAGRPSAHVVVRGEWLWQIARTELTVQGTTFAGPSDAAVDRAARRIYRLNQRVIGADPDRLRPGVRLVIPPLT